MFPWERSFYHEVLNIAIPIVIHSLFMALLHIADNIMISALGKIPLAAVTQANKITFLFQLVVFGLSGGTAAFVAQYWGTKDLQGIRRVMGLSLCLSLFIALCFMIPSMLFPSVLMHLLLDDAEAIEHAVTCLRIISISYFVMAITQCYSTVQKSTEQTRLSLLAGISALATNTFLNYCLIFGNLGFPQLGVTGCAIATVVAAVVELLIVLVGGYALRFATAARLSELIPRSLSFAGKYLRVAMPVIINEGLWSLGVVMYSFVYGRMGTDTIAAVGICSNIEQVAMATIRGVTTAAAVLIGKRIGSGDVKGAYHVAKRMLYAAIPSGLFSGLVLLVGNSQLTQLYNNMPETVLHNARTMAYICACCIWMNQVASLLIVGIMRSGGDMKVSLYLDVGTIWLIGVPMVAIGGLVLGLEIPYVFLMAQLETLVKIVFGLWRFKTKKWIHNLVK